MSGETPMPPDTEPAGASTPRADAAAAGDRLARLIQGLAMAVRRLHRQERRGELAALRRMDPEHPVVQPFQRILLHVAPDASLDRARRIALFVKILALPMSDDVLKSGRRVLGMAMESADVSERRVQTLMTARGEALDDHVLRLARRLAREGDLPFEEIGRLILGDERVIEDTRFEIARAYWAGRTRREDAAASEADQTQPAAAGETA